MSMRLATSLVDRGWVPDPVIRFGIRRLLRQRLRREWSRNHPDPVTRHSAWAARLRQQPIASEPEAAKEQHYEVPARFFELVLGPRLKYSCAYWPEGVGSLAEAEEAMLELTARRAGLADGQRILDLGCGWGSLSLWMAERYPRSEIVAVSNSRAQGRFIRERAAGLGCGNVVHVVADVEALELEGGFDRVVSVEMFEHMRNYYALLEKISGWLAERGSLFVHVFCHRELTYPFENEGPDDWMAHHFFRGGLMPAAGLLPLFGGHLEVEDRWLFRGTHYQRTNEAWLANLDGARAEVRSLFESTYGPRDAATWVERWRVFFMACAELFAFDGGSQWQVAQYRFRRRPASG
jgi:cyclopropane-fatty-acyl-phospholipid synthase